MVALLKLARALRADPHAGQLGRREDGEGRVLLHLEVEELHASLAQPEQEGVRAPLVLNHLVV